ncbi:MAG TPA: acyltransferase family protein [Ilumatobacter sp.]|nr:acyltransferase family protein [Ilumatobacter sp.]
MASGIDTSRSGGIGYQPALDGVRALAVSAVLLFHGGVSGFSGGYLGVSVFFTLSGYLITSLLVTEHDTVGRVDLGAFYGRRLKRLLPASVACLLAVSVFAAVTDVFDGVADLRREVIGCVLQVANWVALAGEGSYQDLLAQVGGTASPLEHFWSLAIEEQFYWVWPPAMAWLCRRSSGTDRIRAVGVITAIALIAAPVIAQTWGSDAAYWATPARIGEILVGAFLALLLHGKVVPSRWAVAAPSALVLLAAAVVLFPSSSGPAYEGALPLVALCSGLLLVGLQADSAMRHALSWRPLVWLGKVSYGVYLFHWPIYVLLDEARTSLDGVALLGVRLAVTMIVASASYYALELPVRHADRLRPNQTFLGAIAATALVAVVALVVVPSALGDYYVADAADAEAAAIAPLDGTLAPLNPAASNVDPPVPTVSPNPGPGVTAAAAPATTIPTTPASSAPTTANSAVTTTPTTTPPPTLPPTPTPSRPVRILVIGDSTAKAFGAGVVVWAAEHPELAQAEIFPAPGCGFVMDGARDIDGNPEVPVGCINWVEEKVYPLIDTVQPDVVAVMVTSWDVIDQQWDGSEYLTPLDAPYAERIERDYAALVDGLVAHGAGSVALLRQPLPDVYWIEDDVRPDGDPVLREVIFDTYDRIADARAHVEVIALDEYFTHAGLDADKTARPDGVHVSPEIGTSIAAQFLGDQLLRVALGLPVA